jgi:hypothetical protein
MRHTFMVMITLLTAGTACGSSHSASKHATTSGLAGANEGSDDVCETTTVTGTNITRVVCRTREQADAERDGAREWLSRPNQKQGI